LPSTTALVVRYVAWVIPFTADVIIASGATPYWSTSTPIPATPASSAALRAAILEKLIQSDYIISFTRLSLSMVIFSKIFNYNIIL
jgi:hypothetical protein